CRVLGGRDRDRGLARPRPGHSRRVGHGPVGGVRPHQRGLHDVRDNDLIVLKIGGSVAGEDAAALDAIASLHDGGHSLVVVHGGGPLVGEWATKLGFETKFVRGLRVTDEATRDVALAVLGGLANARIVAALTGRGVRMLVFVTDVSGVRAKDGKVVSLLDRERAKALVDDGTIEGGMLPKVEACLVASGAGCRAAIVGARSADAVERLLAGERVGT